MGNDIYLIGEVGWEVTLESVIKSVENTDKSKPLNVHIHSGGGSVYDGLAIYNYFKTLEQGVNTISNGLVASIASIIFLAGNKETRKVNSTDSFLIHLPSGMAGGNADEFEKQAKELRDIEGKLANIYANETSLTNEEALEFMKKDEMLDVNFLKEKGFVNEIVEFKAVATFKNRNMSEQLTEAKVENLFEKFFNKYFKKEQPTNKIVQDANGVELDFTELEDSAEPKVGDTANVDGNPAEGDFVMPSGETFKFEAGAITEIMEAVEEPTEDSKLDEANAEIERLKEQLQASAELVNEKETEITSVTNKFDGMKEEFTALKNNVTSNFDYKKKDKKEEPSNEGSRKLFKN